MLLILVSSTTHNEARQSAGSGAATGTPHLADSQCERWSRHPGQLAHIPDSWYYICPMMHWAAHGSELPIPPILDRGPQTLHAAMSWQTQQ